jgi:hypothetical protein
MKYIIKTYYLDLVQNKFQFADEITTFQNLSWNDKLNGFGNCSFELNVNDKKLDFNKFLPMRTHIAIYENSSLVFFGPFVGLSGNYQDVEGKATIYGANYYYHLTKRFSDNLVNFVGVEQTSIIWQLINQIQTRGNGNLRITNDTTSTGINRDRTYEYQDIAEAINNMSEVINGFDFEFKCEVDANNNPDYVRFITYYPKKGQLRNMQPLKIGTSESSQLISFSYDDTFYNTITGLGQGSGDVITSFTQNTALQVSYTRIESVKKYWNVLLQNTLDQKVQNELQENSIPVVQVGLKINPNYEILFEVGDEIPIDLQIPNSNILLKKTMRVMELNYSVDRQGVKFTTPKLEARII